MKEKIEPEMEHTCCIAAIYSLIRKLDRQTDKLRVTPRQLVVPPITRSNFLVRGMIQNRYFEVGKVHGKVRGRRVRCRMEAI